MCARGLVRWVAADACFARERGCCAVRRFHVTCAGGVCTRGLMFSLYPRICGNGNISQADSLEIQYRFGQTIRGNDAAWRNAFTREHLHSFAQYNHASVKYSLLAASNKHQLVVHQRTWCRCPSLIQRDTKIPPCNSMRLGTSWGAMSVDEAKARFHGKHWLFVGDSLVSGQSRVLMHMLHTLCETSFDFNEEENVKRGGDFSLGCYPLNASVTYLRVAAARDYSEYIASAFSRISLRRGNCTLLDNIVRGNRTFSCASGILRAGYWFSHLVVGSFLWEYIRNPTYNAAEQLRLFQECVDRISLATSLWERTAVILRAKSPSVQVILQAPILPDPLRASANTRWVAQSSLLYRSSRQKMAHTYLQTAIRHGWYFLDTEAIFEQYSARTYPLELRIDAWHPIVPSVPLAHNWLLIHF